VIVKEGLKIKGKTCMIKEPSHVEKLSLNHICKIGLRLSCHLNGKINDVTYKRV
jgi:hypothetical protein